jgi:hypothetical protein
MALIMVVLWSDLWACFCVVYTTGWVCGQDGLLICSGFDYQMPHLYPGCRNCITLAAIVLFPYHFEMLTSPLYLEFVQAFEFFSFPLFEIPFLVSSPSLLLHFRVAMLFRRCVHGFLRFDSHFPASPHSLSSLISTFGIQNASLPGSRQLQPEVFLFLPSGIQ